MSILHSIRNLFKKDVDKYSVQNTNHGLLFESTMHNQCVNGSSSRLLQNQFIVLQMIIEKENDDNKATNVLNGFFLSSEVACALDENERALLDLPPVWLGKFELFTKGQTYSNFDVDLRLITEDGTKIYNYDFIGSYLILNGKTYLPSSAQFLALSAVKHFKSISPKERSENDSLAVVYALQKANQGGAQISLGAFKKIQINIAEDLNLFIQEERDGSLHLIPNLGLDLKPEVIENRLNQLKGDNSVCLRIHDKIVLLDENKLAGIQNIISNKNISKKDRENFFQSPASFLDASLINLDNGFALRVYGSETFKPAYFGSSDAIRNDWFGDEPINQVIPLRSCGPILGIYDQNSLDHFTDCATSAFKQGLPSFNYNNNTILLPSSADEFSSALNDIKASSLLNQVNSDLNLCSEEKQQTTVAIALNDEESFKEVSLSTSEQNYFYQNEINFDFLNCRLFPHQIEGIRWLVGHALHAVAQGSTSYEGALLADDMGLGKTLVTLASIHILHKYLEPKQLVKPTLIVAPVILLHEWVKEISHFFKENPFLDVIVLHGDADLAKYRLDKVRDSFECKALKIGANFGSNRLDMPKRLILVSYETLRAFTFSLCSIDWGIVVFDEAQKIKNPNALASRAAKGLKADFRLAVTGTPVENTLTDFWNIFDTVYPGLLGKFQNFRKIYSNPIEQAHNKEAARLEYGEKIRKQVSHFMLRRTKEDNLPDLPDKHLYIGNEVNGIHLSAIMCGEQLVQYNTVLAEVKALNNKEIQLSKTVLPYLHRLRNISLHPYLDKNNELKLPNNSDEALFLINLSAKLKILLDILKYTQQENEKVIIFIVNRKLQQFLSIALSILFKLNIIYVINGDVQSIKSSKSSKLERNDMIDKFQNKSGFNIIIMSPLAAGFGITVTEANNVIHLERHWNPAKENQATDRVYRIGQKKTVNIYIPILHHPTQMSFDDNLNLLLSRKVDLKDAVVISDNIHPEDFNINQLFAVNSI